MHKGQIEETPHLGGVEQLIGREIGVTVFLRLAVAFIIIFALILFLAKAEPMVFI